MKVKFSDLRNDFTIKETIKDIETTSITRKDGLWYPMFKEYGWFRSWENFYFEPTYEDVQIGQCDGCGYPQFFLSYEEAYEYVKNKLMTDGCFPLPER